MTLSAGQSRAWTNVPPAAINSADRVATLDALRGLAAMVVVAMHGRELFWIGMKPYLQAYPYDFSPSSLVAYALSPLISGAIGVSVLFVLSGYVIHRAQIQARSDGAGVGGLKTLDVPAFYTRRFIRIYPTLLLALAVTLICDAISRAYVAHPALGDTSLTALLVNLVLLQGVFADPFGSNSPLWSLAVEVQFYAIYPLALGLRKRLGVDRMMLAALAFSLGSAAVLEPFMITAFPQYFCAWWLGAYMAERDVAGRALPAGWPWISGALLVAGSVAYQRHYFYAGIMFWAFGAAPLISAAVAGRFPRLAASGSLKGLGRFSYTLYAVHFPILVLLSSVLFGGVRQTNILVAVVLTAVAVAVCYGAYWVAEWPSVRALEQMRAGAAPGTTPLALWKARRVQRLAQLLPRYYPPHPAERTALSDRQAADNASYFLSQRNDAVASLRYLLARTSGAALTPDAVDRWIVEWGGALMATGAHERSLTRFQPWWAQRYAGLNAVHDLAVWVGEEAIAADRVWRWDAGRVSDGCGVVLTDGVARIDLVGEVGRCLRDSKRRQLGLASVWALLRSQATAAA